MRDFSRRKTLQAIAVMAVSGIAGCGSRTNTASPSPTDSPSSTDSPTPTETPIPEEQITEYEDLSGKGQELFDVLVSTGSVERPPNEFPSKLWGAQYVRYEDELYSV